MYIDYTVNVNFAFSAHAIKYYQNEIADNIDAEMYIGRSVQHVYTWLMKG